MATAKRGNSANNRKTQAAAAKSGNPAVRAGAQPPRAKAAGKTPAKPAAKSATAKAAAEKAEPKGPAIKPRLGHAHLLTTGDKVPPFTLKTADGGKISLNALRKTGRNGVVVFFFLQADTAACAQEVKDFAAAYPTLQKAGYSVVGISPDTPQDLARLVATHRLPFPLASDPGSKVARKFGAYGKTHKYALTATMPDQLHRVAPRKSGPFRATFVLNAEGRLAQIVPSVQVKGHVGRLLKRLGL